MQILNYTEDDSHNEPHVCDSCSAEFTVSYDPNQTENAVYYCPFCGYYFDDYEDEELEE